MDAYRDELNAAQERNRALEQELAEAKAKVPRKSMKLVAIAQLCVLGFMALAAQHRADRFEAQAVEAIDTAESISKTLNTAIDTANECLESLTLCKGSLKWAESKTEWCATKADEVCEGRLRAAKAAK